MAVTSLVEGFVGLDDDIGLGVEVDAIGALGLRMGAEVAGMTLGPRMELTEDTTNAVGLEEAAAREAVEDLA